MKIRSFAFLIGFTLVHISIVAIAQELPTMPGSKEQAGVQKGSSSAKDALSNIKSARSNISKKDYPAATDNISKARQNLKTMESGSGLGQAEGMTGSKTGASPLSKVDKQLSSAEQALANNQPEKADSLLKKAEAPLESMGG